MNDFYRNREMKSLQHFNRFWWLYAIIGWTIIAWGWFYGLKLGLKEWLICLLTGTCLFGSRVAILIGRIGWHEVLSATAIMMPAIFLVRSFEADFSIVYVVIPATLSVLACWHGLFYRRIQRSLTALSRDAVQNSVARGQ